MKPKLFVRNTNPHVKLQFWNFNVFDPLDFLSRKSNYKRIIMGSIDVEHNWFDANIIW